MALAGGSPAAVAAHDDEPVRRGIHLCGEGRRGLPIVAVIVAVPGTSGVTAPLTLTVATPGSDVTQVIDPGVTAAPVASRAATCSASVRPTRSVSPMPDVMPGHVSASDTTRCSTIGWDAA